MKGASCVLNVGDARAYDGVELWAGTIWGSLLCCKMREARERCDC